jgi:hypothetical protein
LLRTKSSTPAAFEGTWKSSTARACTFGADGAAAHPTNNDTMVATTMRWNKLFNTIGSGSSGGANLRSAPPARPEICRVRAE